MLFAHENEAEYAMHDAITMLHTPHQLRVLFVHLLVNECIPMPIVFWDKFQTDLALDFTLRLGGVLSLGIQHAAEELATLLDEYGQTLSDYGLPQPTRQVSEVEHELLTWSSPSAELASATASLNHEQRHINEVVTSAIMEKRPLLAFIDGKAGRGKTFLVNVLCQSVRASGGIAMATATSAFAAQLYPGGRTTHSALKVSFTSHLPSLD